MSHERIETSLSSAAIHNRNCFLYLKQLKIAPAVMHHLIRLGMPTGLTTFLDNIHREDYQYNTTSRYADAYTDFLSFVEDNINNVYLGPLGTLPHLITLATSDNIDDTERLTCIDQIATILHEEKPIAFAISIATARPIITRAKELHDNLDALIISIYENNNGILPETYNAIKHVVQNATPSANDLEKGIAKLVKPRGGRQINHAQSPSDVDSLMGKTRAVVGNTFKPQLTTGIPTIRNYSYKTTAEPQELRFNTQGQIHDGEKRVSPLFKAFALAQSRRAQAVKHTEKLAAVNNQSEILTADDTADSGITEVYFNVLNRDYRKSPAGKREVGITRVLEALNADPATTNFAVITLPANDGLMQHNEYKNTARTERYVDVMKEFLAIATESPLATQRFKDFYISPNIRNKIFATQDGQAEITALLHQSFTTMGIDEDAVLSPAERQAVWFHFTKFALPNFIITKLNPHSINFSCKDAIDRGGVFSAYYNLMKSIELGGAPLSREEFEQGLHAAPTMVKGRGMNYHSKIIWNAVDAYISGQDKFSQPAQTVPDWLIAWRNDNCPQPRVAKLLQDNVLKAQIQLSELQKKYSDNPHHSIMLTRAQEVIAYVQQQTALKVSGKRLLLETVTLTCRLSQSLDKEQNLQDIARYDALINLLPIKYPILQQIAGKMKEYFGILIRSSSLQEAGSATFFAAKSFKTRQATENAMADLSAAFKANTHGNQSEDLAADNDDAPPREPPSIPA